MANSGSNPAKLRHNHRTGRGRKRAKKRQTERQVIMVVLEDDGTPGVTKSGRKN